MELEKKLTVLNKPPTKTFQTELGIYDCVNIYRQPALDHPLLKNHKIQLRPSYQPKASRDGTSLAENVASATQKSVSCPKGTVPLQRTQKEDLIRAKYFSETYATRMRPNTADFPGHHVVGITPSNDQNSTFYGVKAEMSVYSLELRAGQVSSGQIWIENVAKEQRTSLQAGWLVAPDLMGDNKSHLYMYWTTDNSKTGCYNYICPGFVHVDPHWHLGLILEPTSVYGGDQSCLTVAIFQDKVTGNWWLQHRDNEFMGRPKSLVPQLENGASQIAWGGSAIASPDGVSPPMGNGHFPDRNYRKACYMDALQFVDASYQFVTPSEHAVVGFEDKPECYDLQYLGKVRRMGVTFLFGGPGGMCGE